MRQSRLLILVAFLTFAGSLYADYAVIFNMNVGSMRVGSISQTNKGTELRTSIHIPTFISFRQTIRTLLDSDYIPVSEFNVSLNGRKISSNRTVFTEKGVTLTEYNSNGKNVRFVTNSGRALNLVSVLCLFLNNRLDASRDIRFLNYDKFFTLRMKDLPDGGTRAWDLTGNYEVVFERMTQNGALVPGKVRITKYRFLGINWNVFNLSLKEFKRL